MAKNNQIVPYLGNDKNSKLVVASLAVVLDFISAINLRKNELIRSYLFSPDKCWRINPSAVDKFKSSL